MLAPSQARGKFQQLGALDHVDAGPAHGGDGARAVALLQVDRPAAVLHHRGSQPQLDGIEGVNFTQ